MGMNVGGGGGDDEVVSAINTTPLVDVMLVLLIIFLITIPVATHSVKVKLPVDANQPTQTKPGNVVLAVTSTGQVYWNTTPVKTHDD
ncbi:ExbD/TolR family protein, partial [Gluconobacter japonicus]